MKRYLLTALKIGVPIAILAWLLHKESEAIHRLIERPKDVGLLTLGFGCLMLATCLSFLRWFLLVRALEIPFTVRDAFRLGFLGYLFNFVGPGADQGAAVGDQHNFIVVGNLGCANAFTIAIRGLD